MARKSFDIPDQYRSSVIRQVKEATKIMDQQKRTSNLLYWILARYSFISPDFLAFVTV